MAAAKKSTVVKGLCVVAKRDGFRRAGREWHGTTKVPLDEFSEQQIKQLKNEPLLAAFECDIEADESADNGDGE